MRDQDQADHARVLRSYALTSHADASACNKSQLEVALVLMPNAAFGQVVARPFRACSGMVASADL